MIPVNFNVVAAGIGCIKAISSCRLGRVGLCDWRHGSRSGPCPGRAEVRSPKRVTKRDRIADTEAEAQPKPASALSEPVLLETLIEIRVTLQRIESRLKS